MKLIHKGLAMVEEGDTDLTIAKWLLENTAVPYEEFDTSSWVVTPKPGYLIACGQLEYAILRWKYEVKEKGETSTEEGFAQIKALLVGTYGMAEAQQIIARLAREHTLEQHQKFTEFYTGGRVDPFDEAARDTSTVHHVDINSATWSDPNETSTEH